MIFVNLIVVKGCLSMNICSICNKMSHCMITRSKRSLVYDDLIKALSLIDGKIKLKTHTMLIVEFNHRWPGVPYTFIEVVPFKLTSDGRVRVIYSDLVPYNQPVYFKNRYGNDKELFEKVRKFLKLKL